MAENPEAMLSWVAENWDKLLCHGILTPLVISKVVQPLKEMICALSAPALKLPGPLLPHGK